MKAGSATGTPAAIERLRRYDICYPSCPQALKTFLLDFGGTLAAASEVSRNLGDNPAYSWLKFYGDQGMLNPSLWAEFYLDVWGRAKAPAALPSLGLSVEVERIMSGETPIATLRLRRAGPTPRGTSTR